MAICCLTLSEKLVPPSRTCEQFRNNFVHVLNNLNYLFWKCNIPALLGYYGRPTVQPTNQQKEMEAHL